MQEKAKGGALSTRCRVCGATALSLAFVLTARGQLASAPPSATAPARPQINITPLKSSEIAQRPFSAAIPAPLYPSTARKQAQFIVEYVFNYAQSNYTPPVTLPVVSRASVKRDTPEGALTAFYSAMRSGDYEAWLQCWDEPSRKAIEAKTKQQKNGPEYWRALWRQYYTGKRIVLTDRLETVAYIILDTSVEDPNRPAVKQVGSDVLAGHEGQWLLTNEFTDNGFILNRDPNAPVAKVTKDYEIAPRKELIGPAALTGEAQADFFTHHVATSSLSRTVQ